MKDLIYRSWGNYGRADGRSISSRPGPTSSPVRMWRASLIEGAAVAASPFGRRARGQDAVDHHAANARDPAVRVYAQNHAGGHEGARCSLDCSTVDVDSARRRPTSIGAARERPALGFARRRCRAGRRLGRQAGTLTFMARRQRRRRFSRAPRCSRSWAGSVHCGRGRTPRQSARSATQCCSASRMTRNLREPLRWAEKLGLYGRAPRSDVGLDISRAPCCVGSNLLPGCPGRPQSLASMATSPGFRREFDAQGPEAVAAAAGSVKAQTPMARAPLSLCRGLSRARSRDGIFRP